MNFVMNFSFGRGSIGGSDYSIIFCENIEIVVVVLASLILFFLQLLPIHHLDRFSFNLLKIINLSENHKSARGSFSEPLR